MSYLIERAIALCNKFGLSAANGPRSPDPTLTEYPSHAMILTRRLENHLGIKSTSNQYLGERFAKVERLSKTKLVPRILVTDGHYSEQLLRDHPGLFFVFGDNTLRVGKGGQAIIRDEPNAVGVCTKRTPGGKDEFFAEGSLGDMGQVCEDLLVIVSGLKAGKRYVIPLTPEGRISLGCGLANLPYYAPTIYAFIERWFDAIKKEYGYGEL